MASRIGELRSYISEVEESVKAKDYKNALHIIRNAKPTINNSNFAEYNPNSYILDCLKAKN